MTLRAISDPVLRLERVTHTFGETPVLRPIELCVLRGEFLAIVGPSGCGKTTLLNIGSGWLRPSTGTVWRAGRARTMFQQSGLFPWMTVEENVNLPLRHVADARERARQRGRLIESAGVAGFERSYPHELSGGMRQRAEFARALAGDCDLLLLDEPFSSLDYLTRLRMRDELATLLAEHPRAVLLVTHHIEEAAQLADRVVILSDRPAAIADEVLLPCARPRSATHPVVVAAVHRILAVLGFDDAALAQSTPVSLRAGGRR